MAIRETLNPCDKACGKVRETHDLGDTTTSNFSLFACVIIDFRFSFLTSGVVAIAVDAAISLRLQHPPIVTSIRLTSYYRHLVRSWGGRRSIQLAKTGSKPGETNVGSISALGVQGRRRSRWKTLQLHRPQLVQVSKAHQVATLLQKTPVKL